MRGEKRARRGEIQPEVVERASVTLEYEGLDHIHRSTRVECSTASCSAHEGGLSLPIQLEPQAECTFTLTVECRREDGNSTRAAMKKRCSA